ncbi:MAG: DUF11 domain-containing protein [Chloroflexi bacterium]|nr:DUF11 domain-containing protein [Chloroflexota bacterium]
MSIHKNAAKAVPQRLTQKQDGLIWASLLVGLIGLAGLIYRQGTAPVLAAMAQPAALANTGLVSPVNSIQAQAQITTPNTITSLDTVVVFDISASMEDQTSCHDCWVRTSYNPDYPNDGYFNPLPYNPAWATAGTSNQSIPASSLCTAYPPQPFITGTLQYLTVEAELYSRNAGDWGLEVRVPGQGFFALQRGSKQVGPNALGEGNDQRNAAGVPAQQSSNVCRPNISDSAAGLGLDCTIGSTGAGGDNVCLTGGIAADCSAYIAARPFETYSQPPGGIPNLNGAAYNLECFTTGCWRSSPFYPILGDGPSQVPWVEYDFTPTWNGNTYIWIRAIGGGEQAYTWAGSSPDELQPDLNGGGVANNVAPWRKVIHWQVNNGTVYERKDNLNTNYLATPTDDNSRYFQRAPTWRDNRAENAQWRWIRLNDDDGVIRIVTVVSGTQYTLKLYQGSAGYKIDKIVFTNDSSGSAPEGGATGPTIPAALRRQYNDDGTAQAGLAAVGSGADVGPPASPGSATREACNVCNPAYGYTVDPNQCTCKLRGNDNANGGYGSGAGCTLVLTTTNQLQAQLQAGLYSGLQPIRSAQEAVKNFARQLNPQFDQLGLVPFPAGGDNTAAQADSTRRSKLQCLRWATNNAAGGTAECYDTNLFSNPISFTQVLSATEKHWPNSGTNTAIGMREGLEELGISTPGNSTNSNCTTTINDGAACDRGGAARRILILMTDGIPNANPGNCAPGTGLPDLWDGLIGPNDDDFECAVYFAYLAAQNNITVYTIGMGPATDSDLLTTMATGIDPRGDQPDVVMFSAMCGQYFGAAKTTDLNAIFDQILSQARAGCVGPPPPPPISGQIWALNYVVAQGDGLPVHLENHFYTAGPYDIYLRDSSGNLFQICTAVNTEPATNNGDFSCNVGLTPPGFYDLLSTFTGSTSPVAIAPQQVEVITSTPQIVVNNGAGGNIAAVNSYIDINLIAHQVADQPFDVHLFYGINTRLITSSVSADPGPISWRIPNDLSNPCPPGGSPCLVQSRRVSSPALVYASAELYINQPQIVLAGGATIYAAGETIFIFLSDHTPSLAYDLKLSDGGVNAAWLGRTPTTNATGDTLTSVAWTIPLTWPIGLYTLTSHPAVGSPPRDPASMTSANHIASLSNIQINAPAACADPLSEKSFEPPPLTHWILGGAEGVSVTPGGAHSGNFKLSAPTFDNSYRQPFFYQQFTLPTSVISAANQLKLSLFKNIDSLGDGNDPNDRFYAIVTTAPSLNSTHVTNPVEVANGVMSGASYNPTDWRAVNVLLLPPGGVNLADYAGQNLYLYFYNASNAGCLPVPPFTGCHATRFYFDDVSLDVCSTDAPILNLPQSNPSQPVVVGELFTYTLAVVNNGTADATGLVLTGALDNRVSFVSASDGGQHTAGVVTWEVGALPLGQTITRTLAVTIGNVISGTVLSHTISVSSTEGISASQVVTSTVSGSAAPPSSSVYLPIILKQS